MKNYKKTDLNFFKKGFSDYEQTKNNLIIDQDVPYNYNKLIYNFSKNYLYELGYKKAFYMLTTDEYSNKANYIDTHLYFDKKYSTILPKHIILGEEPDKNFSKKIKKIGDISFEDENSKYPDENVKNLTRLPPDNITEEWLIDNMNGKVELLRLENCYWISKDLISKIGRINPFLKELSLRNLNIDNIIITNLVQWASNIEVLDLSNCKGLSIGICDILKVNCTRLHTLKAFALVNAINDKGIEILGSIDSLIGIDIGMCTQISDIGMINFSRFKIQKLRSLNITGLMNITNKGINEILNSNNNSLEILTISLLPQKSVDDAIIVAISKCKKLNYLDISGCFNISGDAQFDLSIELENLNLSGININDLVAEGIVSSCKNLKILRISNNPNITSNFLDYLINNKNNIMLLEINRTNIIKLPDSKVKEAMIKRAPNLRIIRGCNIFWDMKQNGYKIPLKSSNFIKPIGKGGKAAPKKNDDKNPVAMLNKFMDEMKPKRTLEFKPIKP